MIKTFEICKDKETYLIEANVYIDRDNCIRILDYNIFDIKDQDITDIMCKVLEDDIEDYLYSLDYSED